MKPPGPRTLVLALWAAVVAAGVGALYLFINLHFTEGRLTLPLDDAYIFLQYARNFAAGHPLVYNLGDPPTTGATSYLYLILVTALAAAFRGPEALVWAAFVFNAVLYGVGVWLFALVARRLFQGRYVLLAVAVYATTGPITFHAFAGMDTGLYIVALLAALHAFTVFHERGAVFPLVAALAALTVARPEGMLCAALFAGLALAAPPGGAVAGRKGRPWAVLLGLTLVPFYFLINYAAAGTLSPLSYLSKSVWAPSTEPWTSRAATVLSYTFLVIKNVFCGLNYTFLYNVHNVNVHPAAGIQFAPLAFAFFLVGWGRAARKTWQDRRPSAAFTAGVIFLVGVAASCLTLPYMRHLSRYLVPYYPFFVIGVLGGVEGLAALIRYGRPTISPAAMFRTGAAYFLVFGLLSSAYCWLLSGMSARDIRYQHIAVATFLKGYIPATANIFTHDVGALAYYSGRRVVDLEGLVTRDGWRYRGEGVGSAAALIARAGRPGDYFAGYLAAYPLDRAGVVSDPIYEAPLYAVAMAGGETMSAAPITAATFEKAPPPMLRTAAYAVDELDVGDPLSEEAHHYLLRRRGDHTLRSFAAVRYLADGAGPYMETGRNVCGAEEFTVKAEPGKPLILAVRCEPPFRAWVRVNGTAAGRWEIEPASEGNRFADGLFYVPPKLLTGRRVRIRLETPDPDYYYNAPTRYWAAVTLP